MHNSAHEQTGALHFFLQENIGILQGIIRSYVVRTGLAHGDTVQIVTQEIFNETSLHVLLQAESFSTIRQPRAWFLGIAANIIKRRRSTLLQQNQREFSMSTQDSESVFFDQLSSLAHPSPELEVELRVQVAELLKLASPSDRHVLELAFLYDLDTQHLAEALDVPPGTARVRLHRALNRLRTAWREQSQHEKERGRYA